MKSMVKVCVLMSTFNGAIFLREQIDSIMQQKGVDTYLVVRDDGSTDSTKAVLMEMDKLYQGKIKIFFDKNIGSAKSFMTLVNYVAGCEIYNLFNYFAFSDQDDVWDRDKIVSAVNLIESRKDKNKPVLYFSNLKVVDRNLVFFRLAHKQGYFCNTKNKYMSLIENKAAGCTMVFNRYLLNIVKGDIPKDLYMHDWFFYIIASFFGEIVYDSTAHISYRQHGNNVCGLKLKNSVWSRLVGNLSCKTLHVYQTCKCFNFSCEEKISKYEHGKILKIIKYKNTFIDKLRLIFDTDLKRDSFTGNIKLILFILIGRL